jgi:hypothetical protein
MIESEKIVDWKVNRSVSRNYRCPFGTTELKVIQDGQITRNIFWVSSWDNQNKGYSGWKNNKKYILGV